MRTGRDVREACRAGMLRGATAGLCNGQIQANLIVLPAQYSEDFFDLCVRNPVACPLLAKSAAPGKADEFTTTVLNGVMTLGSGQIDVRRDLPMYMVYDKGRLVAEKADIREDWRSDHVAFLIGCSYSFEAALSKAGLTPRHIELETTVPMYKTTRPLCPAGVFTDCQYVVSMRPYLRQDIERVREITRPYIHTHGEPITWGWEGAKALGIANICVPDWGDATEFRDDEVPVFFACGVTPQYAVISAGERIEGPVMGHKPGCMLVLDWHERDLFTVD